MKQGIETLEKLDVSFIVNQRPQDWAMKCGENIKQEFNERNQLKINTIQMAKKLNIHM